MGTKPQKRFTRGSATEEVQRFDFEPAEAVVHYAVCKPASLQAPKCTIFQRVRAPPQTANPPTHEVVGNLYKSIRNFRICLRKQIPYMALGRL